MIEFDDNMPVERVTWHDMKRQVIEHQSMLADEVSDEAKRAEKNSRFMRLHGLFMDRAIEIAKTQSLNPGTDEAWALIEQAADLAGDLAHPLATSFPTWSDQKQTALSPTDVRDHLALLKETAGHLLIHEIESNDPMPVDRAGFEAGVGAYLKGSVKSPEIDRFILTALIQIEVSAYLDSITRTDPWFQKISELQKVRSAKHPFVYWLLGRAFDLLLAIFVIAIGFAAYRYLGMPVIALIGISLVVAILYVGSSVFTLFRLPTVSKQMAEAKKEYFDLVQTMINVYDEVPLNGPISVRRIREKAVSAEDRGAVWPKAIWPFFDDLASRNIEVL